MLIGVFILVFMAIGRCLAKRRGRTVCLLIERGGRGGRKGGARVGHATTDVAQLSTTGCLCGLGLVIKHVVVIVIARMRPPVAQSRRRSRAVAQTCRDAGLSRRPGSGTRRSCDTAVQSQSPSWPHRR
ncbi:hypothetical protein BC831DRAFT_470240 [Entophlyctis helioformis]|nr:hypothetical protein BC831DRAFT_470240 [Entophlyctis helioformis]